MTELERTSDEPTIGVIGGSGLYDMQGFEDVREVVLSTPFGDPSDAYLVGRLDGVRTVFLPRHGVGHRILPSEVSPRQARHTINESVLRHLRDAGIELAYPGRRIYEAKHAEMEVS